MQQDAEDQPVPPEHWLEQNFRTVFGLPDDAVMWLLDLWHVIQVFDDAADGDRIDPTAVDKAVWAGLVTLNGNPFFVANAAVLRSAMAVAILKWQAANKAERGGYASAKTFMWRAGYYDLVLLVVLLCKGHAAAGDIAENVLDLYGETYDDYQKEFP